MRKLLIIPALATVMTLTACSRSIDMDKLRGGWEYVPEQGSALYIEITDDYFMQSASAEPDGEPTNGEKLKYERTTDGIVVRNTDGKALFTLYYDEDSDTVSYTVKNPDGSDLSLTFGRKTDAQ